MQLNIATKDNKLFVVSMVVEGGNDNTSYLDTKVTQHMSHDKESFLTCNKWEKRQLMFLRDNTTDQIIGQGDVSIKLNNGRIKEMGNVLHVLSFWNNLFSAT
jgi:hypothetical protein